MRKRFRSVPLLLLLACAGASACAGGTTAGGPRADGAAAIAAGDAPASLGEIPTYRVYVGAESADLLHRVRFGPDGAAVENTVAVGRMPTENEGPHGIAITRDGRHLYLTTGHGVPTGALWKYELGPDTLVASEVVLGDFPATVDVTPDGLFAFAVNFNLHGEHVPSDVSVVYTPEMVEVARTETCMMPHGSRINPAGTRQYSACMMDERLVELDTRTFQVSRTLDVGGDGVCSPTWAEPSVDGASVYVACNRDQRILEVDVDAWTVAREMATGPGPYNLEVTPDGRMLVATLKAGAAVEFFDLEAGESVATTPTTTTLPHGVVVSPDARFAFVSVEGVGAEPGKVDIFDLASYRRVASVEVGQQAGGIGFWRMDD